MTKIKKMYKPGQLLTIGGKVYRIKREKGWAGICIPCDARKECFGLYRRTPSSDDILCHGTTPDCYLQLVKPKSSNDGKG